VHPDLVELLGDNLQVGAHHSLVEPNEKRTLLDAVAVLTRILPTVPPVACWIFFTLLSTTTVPGASTAPARLAVPAHSPPPSTSTPTTAKPASSDRRTPSEPWGAAGSSASHSAARALSRGASAATRAVPRA
jgi:hypothetical protein